MARRPKPVRDLLQHRPTLRRLEQELDAQRTLLARVRAHLPHDLSQHCVAAQTRGDVLVLHATSSVWATRLRYLAPEIVRRLQRDGMALREVRVRLLIDGSRRRSSPRLARHSDSGAEIIHDTAMGTKQPELRAALLRLSRALKKPSR